MYTYDSFSRNYSYSEEIFQMKFVKKIDKHFMCGYFFPLSRAVYEIMWKNMIRVRQATDDNITRRVRISCWTTKATNTHTHTPHTHTHTHKQTHTHTHTEYVLVSAFPWQQWLSEGASVCVCYTHVACLVISCL